MTAPSPLSPDLDRRLTAILLRCEQLDAQSEREHAELACVSRQFAAGPEGVLYFDANSIGPMPASAPARMQSVLEQGWRVARRRSWNESDWLEQPRSLGARLSRVLGADPDGVVVCDTTSINHYKLLRFALAVTGRRVIVVERSVFPTNRYVAEGIARAGLAELRNIESIDDLPAALTPGDVAVVSLSQVDYRSSARLDLSKLSPRITAHGALGLWDLSHSAGAVDVALQRSGVDLAVGCGYKYLCGGPGAPSFIYVHPRLRDAAWPALCGWMGHADTFAFDAHYAPAAGVGRFQVGTPAVLANAAMAAAADLWAEVDPAQLEARHRSLSQTLIELIEDTGLFAHLSLSSPSDPARRGGHVALRFEGAQPLANALVSAGVVVSARKPDALRIAPHPLVTRHVDLARLVRVLCSLIADGSWRQPQFAKATV